MTCLEVDVTNSCASRGSVHHCPQIAKPHAYNRCMKFNDPCSMAIQSDRLEELNMFMFDTMCSADMAVDWWCDRFNVSATDEVIDLVCDAHFAMFADQ